MLTNAETAALAIAVRDLNDVTSMTCGTARAKAYHALGKVNAVIVGLVE